MKTLIALMIIMNASAAWATEAKFEKCSEGDMRLLEVAQSFDRGVIKNFIEDVVLPNQASCVVSKPRFVHPAVCGTMISMIDTFVINTENNSSYTIIVDSSYRSCLRSLRVPGIESMKYERVPRAMPFND